MGILKRNFQWSYEKLGDKMNKLINGIILSLVCSICQAQQKVGAEYFHSDDNDDITMQKSSVYAFVNSMFGIGYSDIQYDAPGYSADGRNMLLKVNYEKSTYNVMGDVGVGKAENKTFFVGDLTYTYNVNNNLSLYTGLSGDMVDSAAAIQKGITQYMVFAGIDAHTDKYGLILSGRQSSFSNDNTQEGWVGKLYYTPFEWALLYTSTKRYTNSKPFNGDFYSPDKYERNNIGLTLRNGYEWGSISGTIERNTVGDGNAFSVRLSAPRRAKYQWAVSYSEDTSEYTDFKYRVIMFSIAIPI